MALSKQMNSFELETKIRIIIKELLEATSNKYSFNLLRLVDFITKIDGYERFYIGFTDRIHKLEANSKIAKDNIDNLQKPL
jgi:hypothetical protein